MSLNGSSPPSRGAWIEISLWIGVSLNGSSPPSRGAWIEIKKKVSYMVAVKSPPSRRAWIEIVATILGNVSSIVAPLAGGVD